MSIVDKSIVSRVNEFFIIINPPSLPTLPCVCVCLFVGCVCVFVCWVFVVARTHVGTEKRTMECTRGCSVVGWF